MLDSGGGMISESNQKFECGFCGKSFRKESTLFAHGSVCEKKRRYDQEKEVGVQLGYMAYLKFYEMTQPTAKKNYKDFSESNFYIAFVKFGRHIKLIYALKPDKYIEYLIKENIKLDTWCQDRVYEKYLHHMLRKENPNDTLQRGFEEMIKWGDEQNTEFKHYFKYANENKVCHSIIKGRLSPWIVYNSDTGLEFLGKLSEDQLGLIYDYIDPEYWQTRFQNYMTDTEYMKETLKEAGL